MPPRYVYWTILIDGKPTAFRAREKEELLPTFQQLRRTNKDVVFKWFARGRIWESPEAEDAARRLVVERAKRPKDWRPGGEHKDPRARFKQSRDERRAQFKRSAAPRGDHRDAERKRTPPAAPEGPRPSRPWSGESFRASKPQDFRARKPQDFRPHKPQDFRQRGTAPGSKPQPRRAWTPRPPAPPDSSAGKRKAPPEED